jgi:hypothetical protein
MRLVCPLILALVIVFFPSPPAGAQVLRLFCEAARTQLTNQPKLRDAVIATFGSPRYTSQGDECIYPLQLISYGDADVLLTIANEPGQACHGCAAKLSAYVLIRNPRGSRLVARFIDFDETGTWGNPGEISPVQIGGHDALIIESGGTFQGYSSSQLRVYVFVSGRLIRLRPALPLSASNEGAANGREVSVSGSWHISNEAADEIVIDYQVTSAGRTAAGRAVWRMQGSQLLPKSGRVPSEVKEAGGG